MIWDRSIYEMAGFLRLEATSDIPYSDFWMLPQWKTCEILRDRLVELGGQVELGTALTAFAQNDEGVIGTLTHRGQAEQFHAAYLVRRLTAEGVSSAKNWELASSENRTSRTVRS